MARYAILKDNGCVEPTDDPVAASDECLDRNRFIKQEHYKGFFISTVFIPINLDLDGEFPIHFETYVFNSDGQTVTDWGEVWGKRTFSKTLALELHEEAKQWIDDNSN